MAGKGIITTFYSYKGGTGRTMALANVAFILASMGNRVLAVDWDLEAPGLHRYFLPFLDDPNLRKTPGLLETMEDYVRVVKLPKEDWPVGLKNPLDLADPQRHAMSAMFDFPGAGCLHFLGAGRQDDSYARRLFRFEWPLFYESFDGAGFIDGLGNRAREAYDHILIDSRTGVADTSGICTLQLPDQVILCFTYNRQSVEGVAGVAKALLARDRPYRNIVPVPMRVIAEARDIDEARNFARRHLGQVVEKFSTDPYSYWENAEVAHHAEYGFAETLASFTEHPGRRKGLLADMLWLTQQVTGETSLRTLPLIKEDMRHLVLRRFWLRDTIRAQLEVLLASDPKSDTVLAIRNLLKAAQTERPHEPDLQGEIAGAAERLASGAAATSDTATARALLDEASTIHRFLALDDPLAYRPTLAAHLEHAAVVLSQMAQWEMALASRHEAVEIYRQLAAARPDAFTADLARSLDSLGIALSQLGERESGTATLERAVAAFETALEERMRDCVPLDWAMTQNNLGNALRALGERESGTAALERAVEAFEAALEERTRDVVPLDWAATQNNLGSALQALGERESGTATLERAVKAFEAALEERTRDRVPLDWAMTQNNLGAALSTLGTRESGPATLERAVEAYEAALLEYARDRVPLDWAMTQNNLGAALSTLGTRESGTATLERAVEAYEAALLEYTRDRVPLDWAGTQNNLGNVLGALGTRESGTATLERAVEAFEAALLEYTRDRVPYYLAQTQENLAIVRLEIGRRRGDSDELQAALAAADAALEEFRAGRAEYDIGTAERLRGEIVTALGDLGG